MPSLLSDAQLTQIREQLRQGADVIQRNGYRLLAETLRQADALVDQLRQQRDAYKRDFDAELSGNADMRARLGALRSETMFAFVDRVEQALASCSRLRRALEEKIAQWRETAEWESQSNMQFAASLDQCADELEAALSVRDDGPQTAEKTEETDKAL